MVKNKESILNFLKIAGSILIVILAVLLLWHGKSNSWQAEMAMTAQVYFDGEYRIADGPWQDIVKGKHITATEGDVTLRGNFHLLAPDGEYIGLYTGDMPPIAVYTDHVGVTIYEGESEPYVSDRENPLFGDSACGIDWLSYSPASTGEEPIEIVIHNPHRFGNENAVDEMLSSFALWTGIEFEKGILESGETESDRPWIYYPFHRVSGNGIVLGSYTY